MRRRHGLLLRALVALVAVVLLGGCELEAELGIDLDRDGGGTLRLDLVADAELVERAEEAGVDVFAGVAEAARSAGGWSVATAQPPGGGERVTLGAEFEDPAELAALTTDLDEALDAPELEVLEPFSVELTDEAIGITGGAALVPTEAVADLGLTPQEAVAALDEAVDYRVLVSLPGAVVEATAEPVVPDGPLEWTVPAGERVAVSALGERPPPWWLWPAVAAGVALGLALVAWWWRRRRGSRRRGVHAT